jgi:hypothetical protein
MKKVNPLSASCRRTPALLTALRRWVVASHPWRRQSISYPVATHGLRPTFFRTVLPPTRSHNTLNCHRIGWSLFSVLPTETPLEQGKEATNWSPALSFSNSPALPGLLQLRRRSGSTEPRRLTGSGRRRPEGRRVWNERGENWAREERRG